MNTFRELDFFIDRIGGTVIRETERAEHPASVRVLNINHAKWLCDTQYDGDNYYSNQGITTNTVGSSLLKWE
jgi:hypothetical protein